jgi:hypothetical protein
MNTIRLNGLSSTNEEDSAAASLNAGPQSEIPFQNVAVNDPFWSPRLEVNASRAILHQWQQTRLWLKPQSTRTQAF